MNTLIIYDSTGAIFSSPITGLYTMPIPPIQFLEVEIPEGKIITKVDVSVTPNKAVFKDVPPSELDLIKKALDDILLGGVL